MKVLYGIQATGNGHITRAREIIPELRKKVEVDVLVSGEQTELELPFEVKYKRKGYGFFFGNNGGIDLWKTWRKNSVFRFLSEIRKLNLDPYDIIISDFEPITAWAARLQGKYSVGVGNQYALLSPWVAKPKSLDVIGKAVIRYYAPTRFHYGMHYNSRHESIYKPVIREEIRRIEPANEDYYVVYLPSFSDKRVCQFLNHFPNTRWIVFSKKTKTAYQESNVEIHPISDELFINKLGKASGVFCNAGFGLTTEAIYLQKKLIILPMKMQYEQQCNAFSLKQMGVPVIHSLNETAFKIMKDWLASAHFINVYYTHQSKMLINSILEDYVRFSGELMVSMSKNLSAAQ
jgi:uncharacterized protein (TIGR00661 family)